MTADEAMDRRRLWAVLGSLMLVMLLAALDQTIVATALPTIVGDLGGLEHLSWVVTAYLLAQTVVTPLYGKLGDLFGRKRVLQAAIVVFLIGSVLCGLARTMPAESMRQRRRQVLEAVRAAAAGKPSHGSGGDRSQSQEHYAAGLRHAVGDDEVVKHREEQRGMPCRGSVDV